MSERRRAVILAAGATSVVAAVVLFVSSSPGPVPGPRDPAAIAVREVLETDLASRARSHMEDGVELARDRWPARDGETSVPYLQSTSRDLLRSGFARAAQAGIQPAPDAEILLGLALPLEVSDQDVAYRTYEVKRAILVDASMVASAASTRDPDTNRPLVTLTLTATGSDRFCAASKRLVGRRVAVVIAGEVTSAPVVSSPICGGRITVIFEGPPADREALVAALGGAGDHSWWDRTQPRTWPGKLLFIFGLGALGGVVTLLIVRFAPRR